MIVKSFMSYFYYEANEIKLKEEGAKGSSHHNNSSSTDSVSLQFGAAAASTVASMADSLGLDAAVSG